MKPKYSLVRVRASRRQLIPGILAAALAFALGVKPAQAQTNGTWTGAAGSGIWGGTGNWTSSIVATGTGATASFTSEYTSTQNVAINTARTIGNITFTDTTSSHDVNLNVHTTAFDLTLAVSTGSPQINVTQSGRTLTINNRVAGTAGLTKLGVGTLTMAHTGNTYTGTTIVSAGNLLVGANAPSGAVGALGNSTTEVQLGAAGGSSNAGILINGAFTMARVIRIPTSDTTDAGTRALTLGGSTAANSTFSGNIFLGTANQAGRGVTLTAATGGQATFSGVIQNPAGMDATAYTVTKAGAGTVVLTGANTFTGDIAVNAGSLVGTGATNSPGVTVFGARDNTRTITVNSGGTLQFNSGNVLGATHSATTAPTVVINSGGIVTNGGTATNNALNNVQINGGTLTSATGSPAYGAWNLNGNVTSTGTSTISTSDPANGRVMLKVAGTTNFDVTSGTLTASAPFIDNMNDSNTGALSKSGAGTMTLIGTNTYTGATTVTGGSLVFSVTGSSNSSSSIIINGSDAKLVQNSAVASTPAITLTQGTLTGNGTVGSVTVGNATGGVITNNDGVAGAALTTGALVFNGAATVNTVGNASAAIVAGTLATNAAGLVTVNASAASWTPGTYSLISYGGGSITGAGFGQFALGTVAGTTQRQSKVLGDTGSAITLTLGTDDPPYWAGDGDGKWNLASTNNWKLTSNNSYTTFLAADNVLFNDSATAAGPIAVDINTANVAPFSTTFNHSAKNYTLSGAFGISSGNLTKSGTGTLTITNANSYTGTTVINGGVLDLSTDGAQLYSGATPVNAVVTVSNGGVLVVRNFGQANTVGTGSPSLGNLNNSGGQVVVDGGTLRFSNETSARGRVINIGANGATLDVVNNSTYTWSTSPGTSVPFTGSGQTLTLTGDATSTGTINLVIGGTNVALLKTGAATWTLGGTNTYTGNTTISAGILAMSGNRITGSPTIFIGDGATLRSTGTFILAANQNITGTGTTGNVIHATPGTSNFQTTGNSTISTTGALTISRLDVRGAGNVISGGSILSGGSASGQRGLLIGNTVTGDLTISTGASLTTGASGTNAQDIFGIGAGISGTLIINGGTYTNTTGLAALQLGNNTGNGAGILTINSGSASIGTIVYQPGAGQTSIVNLNGGILTLAAMTSTATGTREFNFDGGQFVASGGLTFPAEVTANVKNGGAKIDTNGFSATVATPLLNSGTGGLIKSGLGTLTLSGVNTYVGGTSVNAGALRFSSAAASTTDVTVAGAAEAGALVAVDNGQWINTGNLTLQNNGVALVDYGSTVPSTTVAPVSVTNFVNGTTPGVKLAGAGVTTLTVGQTLPLVTWTGTGPADGSAFSLRTHRLSGTFSVASNTLSLTITNNAIGAISWNTGNGNWDTVATNWLDINAVSTAYVDTLDTVIFGDAAGATGNPTVTLPSAVSPVAMTMNTSGRNYTVTGAGSIGGSGGLTLASTNTGTFTLATANNTYSGGTSILGGILSLANPANTLSDTGAVTVDGATSELSLGANSDTVGVVTLKNGASITGSGSLTGASYLLESGTVSANLGGTGALTKSTTGTVVLSGSNTFTGATTIGGGTLVAAHVNALSSSSSVGISTATASGTLRLATDTSVSSFPLGASSNFPGTIVSDRATAGAGITHVLGSAIFGNNIWTIEAGANVTSGNAAVSIAAVNLSAGGAGTCTFNPTTASVLIPGAVNIGSNNQAKTLGLSGSSTGNEISGVISNGINTLSVSKTGTSTWTLSGANTYTGNTTISGGTLNLTGSLAGSAVVSVSGSAVLNQSATGSIGGTSALTHASTGTSTLAGLNSYSGATTIDQGIVVFTTNDLTLTGGLTFGATLGSTNVGTLDLSAVNATFGGVLAVQTNSTSANSILIGAGKTLTVGGLTMANNTDGAETRMNMTGGGSLVVNGATMSVGANSAGTNISGESHLNLSALSSFSATITSNFVIQASGDNNSADPSSLTLSNVANTISSPAVRVGNSATGSTNRLWLGGGSNTIQTELLNLGAGSRDSGVIDFAGTGGTVSLRNQVGTGRVPNVNLGVQVTQGTAYTTANVIDLTGNTADVAIGTFATSLGAKTAVNANDLLFDAGILDIRTINMAVAKGTGTSTNRITIGGGIVRLGGSAAFSDAGTGTLTLATAGSGELIINGGTVTTTADFLKGVAGTGTATVTLNGGTLDMGGKNTGTLTDAVVLSAQSGTLSNLGQVNGGGAWTKSGTGTVTLTGTNTYTGAAISNGGTLSVTGTLNPLSSFALGGGTISYGGAAPQAVAGLVINAGASTITNTNSGATNVLNVGVITRNAGGVVNFANATAANNVIQTSTANTNGILGPWALVGGDLAMNDGTGNIVAYSGYTDVTRLSSGSKSIANNAASNVRIVEGTGTAGDITLAASGTTVINTLLQTAVGGTGAANLEIGTGNTLQTNSIVQAGTAGTLAVGIPATTALLQPVTAGGELVLINDSTNALRVNAIISDNTSASNLIVAGSGRVVLTNVNTHSGTTNVNAGSTLQLGDGTSGNDGSIANSLSVVNNGTLNYHRFGSVSYAGVISGTGTVIKEGGGIQTLNGANTYSGGTTINAGTLALGTGGSLLNTGGVFIAPGATLENAATTSQTLSGAVTGGGTLLLSGTGQLILSNAANAYGAVSVTNASRFILNTNATALPATATVALSGGGILVTSVGDSYANAITLGNNGGISTRVTTGTVFSNVTLPATGSVSFNNDDSITRTLTITNGQTLTGTVSLQIGGNRMTGTTASLGAVSLTGTLTGSGGLTLTSGGNVGNAIWGTGSLTLTGANNYTGGTTINQGTLTVGAGGTLGASTGALAVNNANTVTDGRSVVLNLASGVDTTVGSLSGSIATPTAGTNTATINNGGSGSNFTVNQTTAGTYAGVIAGAGNFVLGSSSTNTLTLTGAHTYTGTTTVSAGTLAFVGGSLTSPITVSAGASLSFDISATTTSTSSANISLGTIKITGTPSAASHTLFTAAAGITGTPVLAAPVPGYVLKVVGNSLVLEQAGYGSWAALNGAGVNLNDDHDNDGVPNGVEYFLGGPNGNTTGFTALPGVTNTGGTLSVTWVMGSGYAGTYGANFTVETSETLTGTWTTETLGVTVTVTGSNVTYTFPTPLGSKKFARLKVTGP